MHGERSIRAHTKSREKKSKKRLPTTKDENFDQWRILSVVVNTVKLKEFLLAEQEFWVKLCPFDRTNVPFSAF